MNEIAFPIVAATLAACHLVAPTIFARRAGKGYAGLASFSGGAAVAYVFLYLMPELDEANQVVAERIYFISLVGFIITYVTEHWISRRRAMERNRAARQLNTGFGLVYTFLIVYTLGNKLPHTVALVVVFTASVGLHLMSGHIASIERFGNRHQERNRFLLAGAALAGYGLSHLVEPNIVAIDILVAILAGFILFNVFREELPKIGQVRLWPFLVGIAAFAVLHVVLHLGRERAAEEARPGETGVLDRLVETEETGGRLRVG